MSSRTLPSLPVGKIVATPNALARLTEDDITAALLRHVFGDRTRLHDELRLRNRNIETHPCRAVASLEKHPLLLTPHKTKK